MVFPSLILLFFSVLTSNASEHFDGLVSTGSEQTQVDPVRASVQTASGNGAVKQFTRLNVRQKPNLTAPVITQVNSTDSFVALSSGSQFVQVNWDGDYGYIEKSCFEQRPRQIREGVRALNLRQSLAQNSRILRQIDGGTRFTLIAVSGDRLRIRLADGLTGFIPSEYASGGSRAKENGCSVYPEPGSQRVSGTIAAGSEVQLANVGGFTHIRLPDGRLGWVSSDYVRASESQSLPPSQASGIKSLLLKLASTSESSCKAVPELREPLQTILSQSISCTTESAPQSNAEFVAHMLQSIKNSAISTSGSVKTELSQHYYRFLEVLNSSWPLAVINMGGPGFTPRPFQALSFSQSVPGLVAVQGAPPISSNRPLFVGNLLDKLGEMPEQDTEHQALYIQMLPCESVATGVELLAQWMEVSPPGTACLRTARNTTVALSEKISEPQYQALSNILTQTGLGTAFLQMGPAEQARALSTLSPEDKIRVLHEISKAAKAEREANPSQAQDSASQSDQTSSQTVHKDEPQENWYTQEEKARLKREAPMSIVADAHMINLMGGRYLTGYLSEGNPPDNFVKVFQFESAKDGVIEVALTLVNTRTTVNDQREEVTEQETSVYRLGISPQVVKGVPDTFEFELKKFTVQRGDSSQEDILADAANLVDAVVKGLNSGRYANQIQFEYLPLRKAFRVKNTLAMFPSFPRFKIHLVEIVDAKIAFFGNPDASGLGKLLAGSLKLDEKGNVSPDMVRAGLSGSQPEIHPSQTQARSSEAVSSGSGGEIAHAGVGIHQSVLNDFASSFRGQIVSDARREGWLDLNERASQNQDLKAGGSKEYIRNLARGFESVRVEFQSDSVRLIARGDWKLLSWQSRTGLEVFNSYVADVSNYIGRGVSDAGNAIARGAIHSWNWITQQVGIDLKGNPEHFRTNPQDYLPVSGGFELNMQGRLVHDEASNSLKVALAFSPNSIKDTINPGALERWLARLMGTAEFFLNPFGLSDKIYTGILHAVDYTTGSNTKKRNSMLEYFLDIFFQLGAAFAGKNLVPGLEFVSHGYDDFVIRFVDFSLVEGTSSKISGAKVEPNLIRIEATSR
ncbi:MAG: hypothetical protein H3C47_02195 [Candidatus Cloacimonetes bacterium]|nr:hypothetical protein [Candidatus Cloacimonadota bacterium]